MTDVTDVSDIRPSSVTIIGWLLIAIGAVSILSIPLSLRQKNDPEMRRVMEQMPSMREAFKKTMEADATTTVGAGLLAGLNEMIGYYLLRGANWARYGYFVLFAVSISTSFALGVPMIFVLPSFIFPAIVAACLFNKSASAFFADVAARG